MGPTSRWMASRVTATRASARAAHTRKCKAAKADIKEARVRVCVLSRKQKPVREQGPHPQRLALTALRLGRSAEARACYSV